MLTLGLGVSVIIDATIIRLLIVPALMFIFGDANWWTPAWLDRILPGRPARPAATVPSTMPLTTVGDGGR